MEEITCYATLSFMLLSLTYKINHSQYKAKDVPYTAVRQKYITITNM